MLMGQSHFVPMDFEPSWRLRLFLGRLQAVCFWVDRAMKRAFVRRALNDEDFEFAKAQGARPVKIPVLPMFL